MNMVVTGSDIKAEKDLENSVGFPKVSIKDFRASMKQEETVSSERVRYFLSVAMIDVNREILSLANIRARDELALEIAIPDFEVNRNALLYKQAVYSLAMASIIEKYVSYDATNSGQQKAQELVGLDAKYRRDARWAISDLMLIKRTNVELI
jgi:hypothetical protein